MKYRGLFMAVMISFVLAGCQTTGSSGVNKAGIGTLLGAGLGGWAGSNIGKGKGKLLGVAVGAVSGAFIGQGIGQSLDRADQLAVRQTTQKALENNRTGQPSSWSNPNQQRQTYGNTIPTRTYRQASGQYCREYQQDITVDGKTQRAYGTACRQPDGAWKIMQSRNVPHSRYQAPPRYQQQSRSTYNSRVAVEQYAECKVGWVEPHYLRDGTYVRRYYQESCR